MKAMIFGATGLLGKDLMREWTSDEIVGLGSRDADLRNANKIREVVDKELVRVCPRWLAAFLLC